jgi:hypothetical protein
MEQTMNTYEQKLEARRQRLEGAAEKAEQRSDAYYRKADLREEVSGIPLGQPILVGHHSERRHRRALERADNAMRRSVEESKRAKELAHKAAAVGTGGIATEDPEAVDKLGAEIAKLEALQARMTAANAAIRKHAKAGAEAQVAALVEQGFSAAQAAQLLTPDFCGRIGFAAYQLQNNGANIRRLKARVPQVQAVQAAEEKNEQIGAVEYREEDCRVWLVFPGKPADAIRAELRSHGFKWSPTRGAWVRQLSNAARYHGRKIAEKIGGEK